MSKRVATDRVAIVPLGGVGEIGKNMWLIEAAGEILVLDCGVMFPEEEMFGVDLVIPEMTYLFENRDRIRAVVLSHGHEDHIGALPYLLREVDAPVYGTRLTLGLLQAKLQEHQLGRNPRLIEMQAGERFELGPFSVLPIHVNHSIADVVALAVDTPQGTVVYATDFKFDHTPIDGRVTDLQALAELGRKGVLALLSDSTNAERPGHTLSERVVGETFLDVFRHASGRILVATFASNVHRIQQVITAARTFDRKVAVVGRSMENVVRIATELEYLELPDDLRISVEEADDLAPEKVVVITTGSQGEPMAALSRMAMAEHRQIGIRPGDTVIISANPIPGNEKYVARTINHLFKLGANVIYHAVSGVHVSGHASQEELKLMINLCRPRYFLPIHGEYRMLVKHAELARAVGIPAGRTFILEHGDVLEINHSAAVKAQRVPAGQVLVDGLGVGDVGNVVLRDRRQLSQDGILIAVVTIDKRTGMLVAGPDIVSRGFVYVRESERLLEEAKHQVLGTIRSNGQVNLADWGGLKGKIKDALSGFLYEKTKRRPMILPIVMEV